VRAARQWLFAPVRQVARFSGLFCHHRRQLVLDATRISLNAAGHGSISIKPRLPAAFADLQNQPVGLGSFESVSLADARRKAEGAQRQRADGQDPIEDKRQREIQAKVEAAISTSNPSESRCCICGRSVSRSNFTCFGRCS
jgi:Arm DNA-binding domain